jgi:protein TonB
MNKNNFKHIIMKTTTLVILLTFFSISVFAQNQNPKPKENQYDVNVSTAQKDASYKGGIDSLMNFIWKNIKYPEAAQKSNASGEVQISFDVNFNGTLINFAPISNIGFGLEEELIRVIKLTPQWIPAEVNNIKFRQQYILSFPISRYNQK